MSEGLIVVVTFFTLIVGATILLVVAMNNRRRLREMEHRERLAMIERGLVPAPEVDPAGFEAASGRAGGARQADRFRTSGVTLIGLGLALMILITLTGGGAEIGVGIGGAFAMLGGALLLNYVLLTRERQPSPRWTAPRPKNVEPPADVAP